MKILGIAGWSGSGKTTLITAVIPRLVARGLVVSTLKGTHHDVAVDQPGKDSERHRRSGAREVMLATPRRWMLVHEGVDAELPLAELAARMSPCDLLLVEGFKSDPIAKIEVYRPSLGKPALWPRDPSVVAVASDAPLAGLTVPGLDLGDAAAVAAFMCAWGGFTG